MLVSLSCLESLLIFLPLDKTLSALRFPVTGFTYCSVFPDFFTEDMGVGLNVEWPYWLTIMKEISHSLITINSSLNFLIYIVL